MFSISSKSPNLMLYGPSGKGKTSLLKAIFREITIEKKDITLLTIKGVQNQKISEIQEKILAFTTTGTKKYSNSKIIIIEEIDSFSMNNQMSLRDILEKNYKKTRFIVTCKSLSKVNLAIFSRCVVIQLNLPPPIFLMIRIKEICEREKIPIDIENLRFLIDFCFGDVKKIIDFLSIFGLENNVTHLKTRLWSRLKIKKLFCFSREIVIKDPPYVMAQKIRKIFKLKSSIFLEVSKKLKISEKVNVSFF